MSCYPVTFQDLSYHQSAIACQFACPVRTGGRAYVTAISRGEYERAYLIARETNPFASTCGCVCGAQCEAACRWGVTRTGLWAIGVMIGPAFILVMASNLALAFIGHSLLAPAWVASRSAGK